MFNLYLYYILYNIKLTIKNINVRIKYYVNSYGSRLVWVHNLKTIIRIALYWKNINWNTLPSRIISTLRVKTYNT